MRYELLLFLSRLIPFRRIRRATRMKIKKMIPALCYSQEGEDMILQRIFEKQKTGFYVDIGAHHPCRFSNTALFYKKGWRGINVDPFPGTKRLFDRHRRRDLNLEIGVSASSRDLTYYMFNEPAFNTFDKSLAEAREIENLSCLVDSKSIATLPLVDILDQNLPVGQGIDFLTIDVEGFDFEVLKSNDWKKYLPQIVILESLDTTDRIDDVLSSPSVLFLAKYGYRVVAKTVNSVFLKKADVHE
jgi:FkbM family methyltransferase